MGIGIGWFCPGKMGFKPHWDWDLVMVMGKNVKNQKWEWDLIITNWDFKKVMNWEMGLVPPPPSGPSSLVH